MNNWQIKNICYNKAIGNEIHTEMCVAFIYNEQHHIAWESEMWCYFYFLLDNIRNIMLNKVMFIIIDMYNKIKVNILLINITSNPRDKLDELKATHTYAFFISYVL